LTMHVEMKNLNIDRREQLTDFVNQVTRDRNVEWRALWGRRCNKYEASEIDARYKTIQTELALLDRLRYAINTINNPVPEFSQISRLLDKLYNKGDDNDFILDLIYPLIANANDPRLALRQALCYAEKIDSAISISRLRNFNKDKEQFNKLLNFYKSNAGCTPKFN